MSIYYKAQRTRNLYQPGSTDPFKLSRSKLELFVKCPKCFYLDRRLGINQPPGFPFNLNSAVDTLLKSEFDQYREKQEPHPLMIEHKIDAIPFQHEKMDEWRDSLRKGVQNHHAKTNFIITGGVDDVWINSDGELIVVDYKATSKKEEVSLDADWQMGYKRQMSLYSWLFRQNGFKVSSTGYFVYCNGRTDRPTFNSVLEFKISVIPYLIDESWIEDTISAAHVCLNSTAAPPPSQDCDLCQYVQSARAHFG